MLGQPSGQLATRGEGLVAVLDLALALLRQVPPAEQARAAARDDRPGHAVADAEGHAVGIRARGRRPELRDPAEDLVAEDRRRRLDPTASESCAGRCRRACTRRPRRGPRSPRARGSGTPAAQADNPGRGRRGHATIGRSWRGGPPDSAGRGTPRPRRPSPAPPTPTRRPRKTRGSRPGAAAAPRRPSAPRSQDSRRRRPHTSGSRDCRARGSSRSAARRPWYGSPHKGDKGRGPTSP